jgi:hypothetical protein
MSRASGVLETLTGAAIALGAVHMARRRVGSRGAGGASAAEVLPASATAHAECVREGRPTCTGNDGSGVIAARCPVRYPSRYGMTRDQVERLGEQMRGVVRR